MSKINLWVCCNKEYPLKISLKTHKNSFAHNLLCSCPNIVKFCTGHGSITAMPCAKFQSDWAIEMGDMNEQDFTRFEFKMSATAPCLLNSSK